MARTPARILWSGPPGADWLSRAIAEGTGTTWLVPNTLSTSRLTRRIASIRHQNRSTPASDRIWSWSDLWEILRTNHRDGPLSLSEAGARAALVEAIDRADAAGDLTVTRSVAHSSGFRRRARRRINAWILSGKGPDDLPEPLGPVDLDLQRLFRHYQSILNKLRAVDDAGLQVYYASLFRLDPRLPDSWGTVKRLVVVEPPSEHRPTRLVLDGIAESSLIRQVRVTLTFEADPDRAEAYVPNARLRERLLGRGFVEVPTELSDQRPRTLVAVGQALFRTDTTTVLESEDLRDGLSLLGAPRGEPMARIAASWLRRHLDVGVPPEELLILVPSANDEAALVLQIIQGWGLPVVSSTGPPLKSDPLIQALRLAMNIPINDWDTDRLGRLLRNGRLHPNFDAARTHPLTLPTTAAALREANVYRDRSAILSALDQMQRDLESDPEESDKPDYLGRFRQRRAWMASIAKPVIQWLGDLIDDVAQPGPWQTQVDRLLQLAEALGLSLDEPGLGHLINALDDAGDVLSRIGRDLESIDWLNFVQQVETLINDLSPPPVPSTEGKVLFATVEEAIGVPVEHLLLTNLSEGSFPDRNAIGLPLTEEPEDSVDEYDDFIEFDALAELPRIPQPKQPHLPLSGPMSFESSQPTPFGREMARFLNVVGTAESSLTLGYPTADDKGRDLLAAGFLVELQTLMSPDGLQLITVENQKLDPSLRETEPQSAAEARIKAVARARHGDPSLLPVVMGDPTQRRLLRDAGALILLNARRSRSSPGRSIRRSISRYEGILKDPRIQERLASEFGADTSFSASQLESLALCPFQFFARYVLRLDPVGHRDELEEDRTAGGSRMHAALEELHNRLRHDPPPIATLAEAVTDEIEREVRREIEREVAPTSSTGRGLRAIELARMVRTGARYAEQFRRYSDDLGAGAIPEQFEYVFGSEAENAGPPLVLGEGAERVVLQGMVDRIDIYRHRTGLYYRVIDYKTGSTPTTQKLEKGLALQLPLYAMAVALAFPKEEQAEPLDAGYWALRDKGYRPLVQMAKIKDGELVVRSRPKTPSNPDPDRIVRFVKDLVDRLRRGMFPIHPALDDCERHCDYRNLCRLHQVKQAGKTWPDAPSMQAPEASENDGEAGL